MEKLTDIFKKITSVEVTQTGTDYYTLWIISDGKLEVVLIHKLQFKQKLLNGLSLESIYIKREKYYWVTKEIISTFRLSVNRFKNYNLHLQVGMKIHLKSVSGTYEVLEINENRTILITCNSWKYNCNRPNSLLVRESDIYCLAGGLVNLKFLL